ncbi:hypothetical protein BDV24DRAFT_139297 [Aspergillus arachidicola]|uniref:Uncharacterized protein n=1 Tax=Aspergillus arachidicola TaxID=656916 RepID=A0A5N6XX19_9EURO|nr:hypothetical protein BDV24DRAFT_139297 [Aspergillus arachidicola]
MRKKARNSNWLQEKRGIVLLSITVLMTGRTRIERGNSGCRYQTRPLLDTGGVFEVRLSLFVFFPPLLQYNYNLHNVTDRYLYMCQKILMG